MAEPGQTITRQDLWALIFLASSVAGIGLGGVLGLLLSTR